ncbi:hypothetical protein CDAR_441091 [Caerostris darwini]|uniref:Uncharacterized protein n=1 Tax=Caerostris darwini TaxID=1538125 RepID=A0AAV4Q2M8_9ARAC|nr:hypothetical protein CDAR_441091 [Caerostris darwini]
MLSCSSTSFHPFSIHIRGVVPRKYALFLFSGRGCQFFFFPPSLDELGLMLLNVFVIVIALKDFDKPQQYHILGVLCQPLSKDDAYCGSFQFVIMSTSVG